MNSYAPLPLLAIGDVWRITYFVGLSIGLLFWAWKSKAPLSVKALTAYVMIECLFIMEYPLAHFGPYTPNFQATAGQAFAEVVLVPLAAAFGYRHIKRATPYLAFFAASCVWLKWAGFMHAPSFNMALACMCLPVITFWPLTIFIILTALTHHGSTALLILVSHIFVIAFKKKGSWKILIWTLGVCLVSAYLLQNQPMFNSSERLVKWKEFMPFWSRDLRHAIFGNGPGSFVWYSIMTHKASTGVFLNMYSEPLQILWENGVIGFCLMLGVCYQAIKKAWGNIWALQGLTGCMVFALTYGPLRYFPTALVTAWFFTTAFYYSDDD